MSENLAENMMLTCILPPEQMAELAELGAKRETSARLTLLSELAISAAIDVWSQNLFLVMADRSTAIVPLSAFRKSPVTEIDFSRPRLNDWGHTIVFGEYEAAMDAVLEHAVFRSGSGVHVRDALAFASSVIKCGEPWTDKCERIIGGALKTTRTGFEKPLSPGRLKST